MATDCLNKLLLIPSILAILVPATVTATPPEAPEVAVNTWKQRLQVSWTKPAGAVRFNFYYARYPALDNWKGLSLGNKNSAAINLPVGASFGIRMTAVNDQGEESELSGLAAFEVTEPGPGADIRDPVIFFATSETDSDLFRDVGISVTLETTEKAIYAYDINVGTLVEIRKINSPSYSSSTIRTVTMDDRVFVSRFWNGTEYFEFWEVGGDGTADYFTADALKGCFAVVGDSLYFSERRGEDLFGSPVGEGGFRELELPDANPGIRDVKGSLVFPEGFDDERCGYNMTSSKGVIYDAVWVDDGVISLSRRDPVTLELEDFFFDFRESDAASDFELRYLFSFHDGKGYFVRSTDDGVFQIWEYALGESSANMIYIVDDARFTSAPLFMDAEDDYLILGNNDGYALLIDRRSGTRTWYEIGSYYDLSIAVY